MIDKSGLFIHVFFYLFICGNGNCGHVAELFFFHRLAYANVSDDAVPVLHRRSSTQAYARVSAIRDAIRLCTWMICSLLTFALIASPPGRSFAFSSR